MATRKQKQDLMSALKFTPRDIEITLSGYGGEMVMGRISEAAYDYWEGRDDLSDFVYDWDGEFEDVPADARFCTDGAWHDVDDLCHETGCEASDACSITVYDLLEGRDLWESNLDLDNLASKGVDTSGHGHTRPSEDEPTGTCVFMGQSFEKGTFFSGTIRITAPFDPRKLSISWHDCDGWRLITGVEYDGEDVEGFDGYSTTGKGMEFQVYQVENDNEWNPVEELDKIIQDIPVLEGEETWASRVIDESMKTAWHDGKLKPAHLGLYEVEYQDVKWPWSSTGYANWDGSRWVPNDGRDSQPVKQWRGLREPFEETV